MKRLRVCVLEAKGLPPQGDGGGADGTYVKLKLGKNKSRTRTVKGKENIVWNEEFVFTVADDDDYAHEHELQIRIYRAAEGGVLGSIIGNGGREIIGSVRVPIKNVTQPTWFTLQPPNRRHRGGSKSSSAAMEYCGEVLLTISLYAKTRNNAAVNSSPAHTGNRELEQPVTQDVNDKQADFSTGKSRPTSEKARYIQGLASQLVKKFLSKSTEASSSDVSEEHESSSLSDASYINSSDIDKSVASLDFDEAIEKLQAVDENEMPEDLPGGILLDANYLIEPVALNSFLFEPDSQFRRHFTELEGTTEYNEGPWTWKNEGKPTLRRSVTYTKGATKLVKAIRGMEEQIYLKADGKKFAVLTRVRTPDVPYGSSFEVLLLCKIMPGPELPTGEESSRLIISWNINFHQSTMMKNIIESGTRQGLKESYQKFGDLLSQNIKPVTSEELPLDKEQVLAPLQEGYQSDLELAVKYFCNFSVISTVFMGLYILLHIFLSGPSKVTGLEFFGLDLPDTFGELITSGILVLQGERVFNMISHFVQARLRRVRDQGGKTHGEGWLITVALVEASNLPSLSSTGWADPYVVFSCGSQTRTSSVQLQTQDPQWNEILEFDTMKEPPSVLKIEVYDFDSPFDQSVTLGHAEVNFLKHSSSELADMWIPLEGRLAQAAQSQLHVRIFLETTKGVESMREYLKKMEKQVGKKLKPRSPHRNSTFQKIFNLPPEEFLIKDFACYLRKKIPLQGRLFLSARIVGFYSNIFGRKTTFYFLWEDVEDIRVLSPSLATVGTPALLVVLKKGQGHDARHGAKSRDDEGRLRFQFQGFGSFNVASRTIMALWKSKSLSTEDNLEVEEDQSDQSEYQSDDDEGSGSDESSLSKVFSAELPISLGSALELFGGGQMEKKIMERVGCLNYLVTPWKPLSSREYERHVHYKINSHLSFFGVEVTSTQQKIPIVDSEGWIIDEVMTLHNIPFGDHFQINMRYQIETVASSASQCRCEVYIGVTWLKSIKFQRRISKNICDRLTQRAREMFEIAEEEFLSKDMQEVDTGESLS